jgi:CheY-like chemotaxis protein
MTMTRKFAPHLPYLRRYARALTGSQESGDAYVRASLTAVLSGECVIDPALHPRIALYRLFHQFWSNTGAAVRPAEFEREVDGPEGRLLSLSHDRRAALLLTAVEYFSLEEAAAILGKSVDEVERANVEAQQAIESELVSRILIIEDEPVIALDLENLVTELGHEVVGTASSSEQAIQMAFTTRPGLILVDINLGEGGSGLDAVNKILAGFDVPVIFVTAYPEKLLTGERPEPTYLIAKPFLPEAVQATVGQALFFRPLNKKVA